MSEKARFGLLDALRGFSMISMVLYHAMYDLAAIYGFDAPWYFEMPGRIWQQSICCTFIFLSGMCHGLSRSPINNGAKISLCGLVISAVTLIFMPSQVIIMGVLSFLGLAAIIMVPLSKMLGKRPRIWFWVMSALFLLTRDINRGYLGAGGFRLCELPESLYSIPLGFVIGFVPSGFYSSDYFSLMPWFFLFAAGYCFWQMIKESGRVREFLQREIPLLSRIGRHSLIVYMLHQPIIMAVFMIAFEIL